MSFWFWQWICGNRLKLVNRRLIQPFLIGYKKWVVLTKYNGLQQLHNTSSCKHASLMVILAILFNQQMDYNNYKIKINENIPRWLFSVFFYPVQHTKKIITLEMNSISNSDFHKIGLILKILLFPRTALMCHAITPSHKNYLKCFLYQMYIFNFENNLHLQNYIYCHIYCLQIMLNCQILKGRM